METPIEVVEDIPIRLIFLLVFLLFLTGVSTLVLQKMRFPYTIGLVVVGRSFLCSAIGGHCL